MVPEASLSHPQLYGRDAPYGTTLLRLGVDPTKSRAILMAANQKQGTSFDRTRAIASLLAEEFSQPKYQNTKEVRQWARAEMDMAQVFTMFCESGRIIYEFNDQLTEAFQRSNLGDARVEDIKLPFPSFFMRFRSEHNPLLSNGRMLDGCYVYAGKDMEFIGLRFVSSRQPFWPDMGDLGIPGSIEMLPSDGLLYDAVERGYLKQDANFEEVLQEAAVTYGMRSEDMDMPQRDYYRQANSQVRSLLELAGNALLFLSAYSEEVEAFWPSEAPPKLIESAEQTASLKRRRKAFDDLWFLGYSKIRYAGKKHYEGNGSSGSSHAELRIAGHWRTGHWRRQPYGPENMLRKVIWIRPIWVSGALSEDGRDGSFARGRIIDVAEKP